MAFGFRYILFFPDAAFSVQSYKLFNDPFDQKY